MSRAANTLLTSDVLTTPIKLKYSSSYDSSSYYGAGIRALRGDNGPITTSGSIPQATLNYRSIRHLFYSNYLSGSYPVSSSAAFNWEQSTAASGTLDADLRIFPTGSGEKVKILSIPRSVYGEKISRKSFRLYSEDGFTYDIIDDGNGNLIDVASDTLYVNTGFFNPRESFTVGYTQGPSRNAHVGNIIYSQGLIIITNQDYYNVLDAGPLLYNNVYTYIDTDVPKEFSPLLNAQPDSSPINTASLALVPIPGQQFPSYTIAGGVVTLTPSDPLYTTIGAYYINYHATSSIGTPSNTANINVNIIPNCQFSVILDTFYYLGTPRLVFDFTNQVAYTNSGSTVRDLSGQSNNGTFSFGTGTGTPIDIYTYSTATPGFLVLPSATRPSNGPSVALPDFFKYTGTSNYTFVAWVKLHTLGFVGNTPGIVAAEGDSGGNPIGWAWYFDDQSGVRATRYDGAGGGDTVLLPWTLLGSPSGPIFDRWMFLTVTYDGTNLIVGGFRLNHLFYSATTPSATSITSDPAYACFLGQRFGQFPQMDVGYLASYDTALTSIELATIYSATKSTYGL